MAARCQFSETMMQSIIEDVFDNMDGVINLVTNALPKNFPQQISESIFAGMRQVKTHCVISKSQT